MADCYEIAHHLYRSLAAVKGLEDVEFHEAEFGPYITGKSVHGKFYIQMYPDPEGAFYAVQALAMPSGKDSRTLGFWQPRERLEATTVKAVKAIWDKLYEQEKENRELERVPWLPIPKLPRVKWEAPPPRVVTSVHEHPSDSETNIGPSAEPVPRVSTSGEEEPDEEEGVLGMFGI